jgi:hypothetical protein
MSLSPTVVTLLCIAGAVAVAAGGYLFGKALLLAEEQRLRRERRRTPRPLTVTFTVDTSGFERGMRQAARALNQMGRAMARASEPLARFAEEVEWQTYLRRQLYLARASAIIGVRAGLDPDYATPEALHLLVAAVLHPHGQFSAFTPEERLELAVSAIHGWAHGWGRNLPRIPVAEVHRYGATDVVVVAP